MNLTGREESDGPIYSYYQETRKATEDNYEHPVEMICLPLGLELVPPESGSDADCIDMVAG
jgi:hypothetical protein